MKKRNIIASVLLTTIILTWISHASDRNDMVNNTKGEMRELFKKVKSWENLTANEQEKLNNIKNNFNWKIKRFWKKWGHKKWWLTDEEKTAIESMTYEEKKDFFKKKRDEKKAERKVHRAVITKLINWEELTSEEKKILEEIKKKRAERLEKRKEMNNVF